MENVTAVLQPEHSLISEQSVLEGYVTNCLSAEVSKVVVLSDLIEAFRKHLCFVLDGWFCPWHHLDGCTTRISQHCLRGGWIASTCGRLKHALTRRYCYLLVGRSLG